MNQVLAVHGIATIDWDSALLPDRFWRQVERLPNGCWVPHDKYVAPRAMREHAVGRLTERDPYDIWAAVPTCGNGRCVNPAHLCVTMKTPLTTIREHV